MEETPCTFEQTEDIGELVKALCGATLEFQPVNKNQVNPHFNIRYADMSALIEATREPLAKHGLNVMQPPVTQLNSGEVTVITQLSHTSNQWIRSRFTLPAKDRAEKLTPQSVGSAISYGSRYAYARILNIAPEDEDDGNAASGKEPEAPVSGSRRKSAVDHRPAQPTQEPRPGEASTNPDTPTKEEKAGYAEKLRSYPVDATALGEYVLRTTDTKALREITRTQWATLFGVLDQAHKQGEAYLASTIRGGN